MEKRGAGTASRSRLVQGDARRGVAVFVAVRGVNTSRGAVALQGAVCDQPETAGDCRGVTTCALQSNSILMLELK
jgi:hypothetical protein